MVRRVELHPHQAHGNMPKIIEEFIGRVNTGPLKSASRA